MPRQLVVLALLGSALAQPRESKEVEIARDFLRLHRAKDSNKQALVAAQSAAEVQWPLVVNWLLRNGEREAALRLAVMRAGNPADGPGLAKLVAAFVPVDARQQAAFLEGRALLQRGRAADALAAFDRCGAPLPASVFSAQVLSRRSEALLLTGRKEAAHAALVQASAIGRDIGWWLFVRDIEQRRLGAASTHAGRLAAADGLVLASQKLSATAAYVAALQVRARVRLALAQEAENDTARGAILTEARKDYHAALALVEDRRAQAIIHRNIAVVFQAFERPPRPREALKQYDSALEILRGLPESQRGDLPGVLFNAALVDSSLGRYGDSLERIDELLAMKTPLRPRALQQRAYALWRQQRLEKAVAAYEEAIAAARAGDRPRLRADLAELHLQRGDFAAAERRVAGVDSARARVVRGRALGRRGAAEAARAEFTAALAATKDPVQRVRFLLIVAAEHRNWGDVDGAFARAREALAIIDAAKSFPDVGNAAVAWLVAGDLALLARRFEAAEKMLGNAAALFLRLNDPSRAIPAYVQWTLLLVSLDKMEPALQRLGVLMKRVEATSNKSLKSAAKCAEAIFEARAGRVDGAIRLLEQAETLAADANDDLRRANALVHRALLDPSRATALVDEAHVLLDRSSLDGPEEHPLLEGHRPDYGASIAVAALLADPANADVAAALRLIERARADRMLQALRGRASFLGAALYGAATDYAATRGRVIEARVEGKGVAEAEAAHRDSIASLPPRVAALAFPRPVVLADVQRVLRDGELLLVMLDDPYVPGALVAVTKTSAALRKVDLENPLACVADEIAAAADVLVAPDGRWAVRPLETAPWRDGLAADAVRFYYVTSAAAVIRARTEERLPAQAIAVRSGAGPARLAARTGKERVALLHLGGAALADFAHPQASRIGAERDLRADYAAETVVIPSVAIVASARPRAEGVGVLAAIGASRGVNNVILSLGGAAPAALVDRFYGNCLGKIRSPYEALREAKAWFRATKRWKKQAEWAGLVYFGVPR